MRRILLVLSVVALMAAMMVAMAVPAFAVANPQASCGGEAQSSAEAGD
jgi:type II secretory pathway component PulK